MQPGTDPHWFIDGPLAEFNEHMQASLRPSHLGCMDETGCVWRGGESEGDFKDSCSAISCSSSLARWCW